jgi:hypothetical protein
MPVNLDGLWWLLLLLGPLIVIQRRLHLEIQYIFYLITRSREIALALFSFVFFPGVFLHEASHFVVARLLGVRTGHFSLLPKPLENGRLQLGYVETAPTDVIRDALIGAAPLMVGGAFVAYAGLKKLGLPAIWESLASSSQGIGWNAFLQLPEQPDFWIWFYLTFAVSSTMLPSSSDRRAWLPLSLLVALLLGVSLLAGAGPWMVVHLAPVFNQALRSVAIVFGISVAIQLVLVLPFWLLRHLLSRLTGLVLEG